MIPAVDSEFRRVPMSCAMTVDLDRHFRRESFKRYALQCGLAGFVVLILLLILDAVTQTVLIAALGASAFIAFAVPR